MNDTFGFLMGPLGGVFPSGSTTTSFYSGQAALLQQQQLGLVQAQWLPSSEQQRQMAFAQMNAANYANVTHWPPREANLDLLPEYLPLEVVDFTSETPEDRRTRWLTEAWQEVEDILR